MFTWPLNTGVLLIGENVVVLFCVVGVEVLFRFKAIYFIICKLLYEILSMYCEWTGISSEFNHLC